MYTVLASEPQIWPEPELIMTGFGSNFLVPIRNIVQKIFNKNFYCKSFSI